PLRGLDCRIVDQVHRRRKCGEVGEAAPLQDDVREDAPEQRGYLAGGTADRFGFARQELRLVLKQNLGQFHGKAVGHAAPPLLSAYSAAALFLSCSPLSAS